MALWVHICPWLRDLLSRQVPGCVRPLVVKNKSTPEQRVSGATQFTKASTVVVKFLVHYGLHPRYLRAFLEVQKRTQSTDDSKVTDSLEMTSLCFLAALLCASSQVLAAPADHEVLI